MPFCRNPDWPYSQSRHYTPIIAVYHEYKHHKDVSMSPFQLLLSEFCHDKEKTKRYLPDQTWDEEGTSFNERFKWAMTSLDLEISRLKQETLSELSDEGESFQTLFFYPNLSGFLATRPREFDLSSSLLPARSQGKNPTCLSFACCTALEYHLNRKFGNSFKKYMSPKFLDSLLVASKKPLADLHALEILKEKGCCIEDDLPDDETSYAILDPMPQDLLYKASSYKISSFSMIEGSDCMGFKMDLLVKAKVIDQLKYALAKYGPCITTLTAFDYNAKHFWAPSSEHNKELGNHAVVIIGYDADGFIIRNSWKIFNHINHMPFFDIYHNKRIWYIT